MKKTKAEALKTREYLMLAALDTFYERGVSRASLNEIAQNAGVTRGALYWHFKNKEDLFDALFQHIFHDIRFEFTEEMDSSDTDTLTKLQNSLENVFVRMETNETYRKFSSIIHLKCEHIEQNQSITSLMHSYIEMWKTQISRSIAQCVKQGQLPQDLDIVLATSFLGSAVIGLIQLWLHQYDNVPLAVAAPVTIRSALGALQHSPYLRIQSA